MWKAPTDKTDIPDFDKFEFDLVFYLISKYCPSPYWIHKSNKQFFPVLHPHTYLYTKFKVIYYVRDKIVNLAPWGNKPFRRTLWKVTEFRWDWFDAYFALSFIKCFHFSVFICPFAGDTSILSRKRISIRTSSFESFTNMIDYKFKYLNWYGPYPMGHSLWPIWVKCLNRLTTHLRPKLDHIVFHNAFDLVAFLSEDRNVGRLHRIPIDCFAQPRNKLVFENIHRIDPNILSK